METFETSFHFLLRNISQATLHLQRSSETMSLFAPEQSETEYQGLLRCIFKKGGPHDASRWGEHDYFLRKITFKKGGLHADPEVDMEHLPIPKAEKVFGREHEVSKLLLKCCYPDEEEGIQQLCAIPIVGAAGIGKTTLARLIFEDELVLKHFEMRVWVKVDGQEFNLHHAAQQILKSAMGMACSTDDLDELNEMVSDTLQERRCLIVFDGVESMAKDVWLHINNYWLYSVDMGSIVLITTPSDGVANLVSNEPFELKQLFPNDAWSLYQYLVVGSSYMVKEDTSRNLEALCAYIPLLLKLVGSMMTYHANLRRLISKVHFADAISALRTFDVTVSILLCVWALPPQLRQCLAFCAIFPIGYGLDRKKIIYMWAAHGLLQPSSKNSLHDIGDSYFHQLLCRSFFTDIARNEYGDITEFRMPSLIHPIMQDVASIVWKGKIGAIGSINKYADQLSVHMEGPEDLRTLILSSTLYSGVRGLDYTFRYFQELETLDLSCSGIQNLSDDICSLTELRYLNLSYTLIETLPDSIMGLPQLQTLDLSWCYHFKVLPKVICNLKYLSHLDLFQCELLSHLPSGIGFLKSLTLMPLFVLGKDHDSAHLGELAQLNQLKGRLDIKNLENVQEISEAREAKLNKKKLQHLGLCWSKDVDGCFEVLKFLKPNRQLKVLDITGYMGSSFPRWISSMSSLVKMSITDCGCKKLPSLGQLTLLKELQLKGMASIQYIGPEFYGTRAADAFPSLEQLGLYDMPTLYSWSGAGGSFTSPMFCSLKTLTIEECPWLEKVPTFGNLLDLIVCNSNVKMLSYWNQNQISFGSPSSLLIKNMELEYSLQNLAWWWPSLKKLTLFNSSWLMDFVDLEMLELTDHEHLTIAHCPQVGDIRLIICTIQKLHLVDCPNLGRIYFSQEPTKLTELVVDKCPRLYELGTIRNLGWINKLIIRGSDRCIRAGDFKELKKLQYLSISECPQLEKELEMEPSLVSHIPCVLLPNRKVQYKHTKESEYLREG